MTWGEFKRLAEERGVRDEDTIVCIDVSCDADNWTVERNNDEVSIW